MKNDDFFVQQGVLKTIPIFGLVNKGVLFSANGNNPNTPYKAFIMPHAPGQISLDPFSDSANFSIAYRLRPDEAIIFIGRAPPSCKYFSYQSFMLTRYDPRQDAFKKIFANL